MQKAAPARSCTSVQRRLSAWLFYFQITGSSAFSSGMSSYFSATARFGLFFFFRSRIFNGFFRFCGNFRLCFCLFFGNRLFRLRQVRREESIQVFVDLRTVHLGDERVADARVKRQLHIVPGLIQFIKHTAHTLAHIAHGIVFAGDEQNRQAFRHTAVPLGRC